MKDIVIIGAGGFGREVAWLVERINAVTPQWNLVGFIDDSYNEDIELINGYPVLGNMAFLKENNDKYQVVCAVGNSSTRKKIIQQLHNCQFATLIDPSVIMSALVTVGAGTIICANTVITVNCEIGEHVIINLACSIGHDAELHDYVTVYPTVNISGNTSFGECVEIGTGSQIIQGLAVGENTIIGAGSVVVKSLPDNCTAVGCPAKPIKFHN